MTLPSGGTGARRRSFSNSKVRGAPVTVYVGIVPGRGGIGGSWITVSSCIFVGTRVVFKNALVAGPGLPNGDIPHCSIHRLFSAFIIEIMMAIFTSPSELVNHHCASLLRPESDSESPVSKTIVGQSSSRGRHLGLYVESPSLEELRPRYVFAPRGNKLSSGKPIPRSL